MPRKKCHVIRDTEGETIWAGRGARGAGRGALGAGRGAQGAARWARGARRGPELGFVALICAKRGSRRHEARVQGGGAWRTG